jgi:hypothetical protein
MRLCVHNRITTSDTQRGHLFHNKQSGNAIDPRVTQKFTCHWVDAAKSIASVEDGN